MFSRTAGGTAAAADAAAMYPGPYSNAADFHQSEYDAQCNEPGAALPGVAYVNFRRRTVHAPGYDDSQNLQGFGMDGSFVHPSASSVTGSYMQFGSSASRAGSCSGTPYSMAATKNSIPTWASTASPLPQYGSISMSHAGTMANSVMACPAASTVAAPSTASCSTPSTPASPKRNSKPKWLKNVLKYARTPRSKQHAQKHDESILTAQQQQEMDMQLQQQLLLQEQEQQQLQMQMQLAEQEELAFQQQLYEHGWDQLPEKLQQQLRDQFHAEFILQLQQQERLQHELQQLQAAYPNIDPAILQEQLMQQFQQTQEQQAFEQQQYAQEAGDNSADVYEQHLQYEHLQQQLAGLQLPDHVQSLIHQHQQQQQPGDAQALPLQTQEFVYAAAPAVDAEGGEQGPLVHVLDGPNGQVVHVTPDEFQDILTVMQALADARRDLAVRLQPSAGGQATQGGNADPQHAIPAAAGASADASTSPQDTSALPDSCADAGVQEGVAYNVLQISAGDAFGDNPAGMQAISQQQEHSDAQMPQDMNGPPVLVQDIGRSQSTGGRLDAAAEKQGACTLGVVGGMRASSGGRKAGRPSAAASVKQTLFDFTPADPAHAEVHYMRATDQEDFRIKARPNTCQGFPASPRTLARRHLQRSVPGSLLGAKSGRPHSALGSPSSNPSTPTSASRDYFGRAVSTARGDDDASRGRVSVSSTLGSSVGSGRFNSAGRARSASTDRSPLLSDEARESAKVALQKYRAAFELMRLREKSHSCSGWTDDGSPTQVKQTAFQTSGAGAACSPENEAAIKMLTKKVAELEAGLSALLSGQAIPPAAAAALIAAISNMGTPSTQLVQALHKGGSLAGNASRGGKGGSRNPSEGAALSVGGKRAAAIEAEAKPKGVSVLAQPAAEDSAELDSVIQTINQAQSQYQPQAQQKRQQQQQQQQQQQASSGTDDSEFTDHSRTTDSAASSPTAQSVQFAVASKAQQAAAASSAVTAAAPTSAVAAPAAAAAAAAVRKSAGGIQAAAAAAEQVQQQGQEEQESLEEDLKRATGAFDAIRFEAHSKKEAEDMARRAANNNYDSDIEEEEAAAQQQQQQQQQEAETAAAAAVGGDAAALKVLAEAERKLKELHEQEERLKALWAEQEEWMSTYRQGSPAAAAAGASTPAPTKQDNMGADSKEGPVSSAAPRGSSTKQGATPAAAKESANKPDSALAKAEAAADAAATRGLQAASQSAAAVAATATAAVVAAEATTAVKASGTSTSRSKPAAALSPAEEAIVTQRFVPTMSDEFPEFAAVADAIVAGDLAAEQSARMLGLMPPRSFDEDEYEPTAAGYLSDEGPEPYAQFARQQDRLHAQRQRSVSSGGSAGGSAGSSGDAAAAAAGGAADIAQGRKSIAAVKLEQDLEITACEQAAIMQHRFVANPVPRSTRELRYHQMMAEQHAKRAATHQKYLQLLASQQQPFSFQQEEAEAAAAKAAKRAAAHDPNRFQRQFKAKPVPAHVYEHKHEAMMAAHEAAKLAAKVKADMAKERVQKAIEEDRARRSAAAASNYQEHLEGSMKPIKTKTSRRSSSGGSGSGSSSYKASPSAATASKLQEQPSGAAATAAAAAASSACNSPAFHAKAQPSKAQQPHPFAQAAAAGKELQGQFPVLHTTYSTDGDSSAGGADSGALSGINSMTSEASNSSTHLEKHGERSKRSAGKGSGASSGQKAGTPRRAGGVPDYKALHERWEAQQAAKKLANAKRVTVPEPPSFVTTPAEDEGRAAERRAKVEEDVKADETRLSEQRWPFTGPRAAAKPSPVPAHIKTRPLHTSSSGLYGSSYASYTPMFDSQCSSGTEGQSEGTSDEGGSPLALARPPKPISAGRPGHRETAAALLRAQATKQAMMEGKFDTREEKERKAQGAEEHGQEEKARRGVEAAARAARKKEMMNERSKLLQQLHDMKAQDAASSAARQRSGGSPRSPTRTVSAASSAAVSPTATQMQQLAAAPATAGAAASSPAVAAVPAQQGAVAQAVVSKEGAHAAAVPLLPGKDSPAGAAPAGAAAAEAPAAAATAAHVQQGASSNVNLPTAAEVAAHLHRMLADDNPRNAAASREDAAASRALAEGLAHSISNSASAASAAAAAASAAAAAAAAAAAGAAGAASCVAAAAEQQPLGASRPASGSQAVLAVEALGLSCVETSSSGSTADKGLTSEVSHKGCKVIPPVAAPAKSLPGLSRSNSLASATGSTVKPLVPSVLPSGQGGCVTAPGSALGSRQGSATGSCDLFASAEQAMELATAALAAERPASPKRGATVAPAVAPAAAAAPAAATSAAAAAAEVSGTAAAAAQEGAQAKAEAGGQPVAAAAAARGAAAAAVSEVSAASAPCRSPASNHEQQQQEQNEQQQEEGEDVSRKQPAQQQQPKASSGPIDKHHLLRQPSASPEQELVQIPPSLLSVKDRIKAINAAGRTSPVSSFNGSMGMRSDASIDSEASGSYKPCHGWGRSMGCATASFSNNAASRAHVSLIDQLRMSQVGTMVERSTVTTVVERRRAPIAGRQDAPLMHIEARHAQAEKRAKELVDEALRAHGIRKGYKEVDEDSS